MHTAVCAWMYKAVFWAENLWKLEITTHSSHAFDIFLTPSLNELQNFRTTKCNIVVCNENSNVYLMTWTVHVLSLTEEK